MVGVLIYQLHQQGSLLLVVGRRVAVPPHEVAMELIIGRRLLLGKVPRLGLLHEHLLQVDV